MREAGASPEKIRASRFLFDSRGLLREGAQIDDPHKRALATPRDVLVHHGLEALQAPTPEDVIRRAKPTVLIGATAAPGTFRRTMIEEMARHVERPIVMPLSNPTSKAECSAQEAITWSRGRALVAAGSPFADVVHDGTRHVIGQANNVFVFPGIGMGTCVRDAEVDERLRSRPRWRLRERGTPRPGSAPSRRVGTARRQRPGGGSGRAPRERAEDRPPRRGRRGRALRGGRQLVSGLRPDRARMRLPLPRASA
jgi:hypothetical protein